MTNSFSFQCEKVKTPGAPEDARAFWNSVKRCPA
jgi:hypothetical protein